MAEVQELKQYQAVLAAGDRASRTPTREHDPRRSRPLHDAPATNQAHALTPAAMTARETVLELRPLLIAWLWSRACTPEIGTDPAPAVMEFDPNTKPPRVSEPSFVVLNPMTGRDRPGAGGDRRPRRLHHPARACRGPSASSTSTWSRWTGSPPRPARARRSARPVDLADRDRAGQTWRWSRPGASSRSPRWRSAYDGTARYLVRSRPPAAGRSGGFIWMGVRGYDTGIRAGASRWWHRWSTTCSSGSDSLTCGAASAAAIADTCPYLGLLAQQMSVEAARASLVRLEALRTRPSPSWRAGSWCDGGGRASPRRRRPCCGGSRFTAAR